MSTLAYVVLFILLLPARISVYTLAAWGMMVWAIPMLFDAQATPAGYIYGAAILSCLLAHHLARPIARPILLPVDVARNAAYLHHVLLGVMVAIDGGFSGFLSGKYGALPGGNNVYLFYAWNSTLYIAWASQILSPKMNRWHAAILAIGLGLLVVKGDRTILAFVVIALITRMCMGTSPLALLLRFRALAIAVVSVGLLFVAKDMYGLYAEGRSFDEIFESVDLEKSFTRLESWHNYSMLNNVVDAELHYPFSDFIVEPLAVIPGSWVADIDPHRFSALVKEEFFSDWSENAGVGASYFGQFYALGTVLGVIAAILLLVFWLYLLHRGLRSKRPLLVFFSVAALPLIVFYIHRNSIAQLSSFVGRYLIIATVVFVSTKLRSGIRTSARKSPIARPHA